MENIDTTLTYTRIMNAYVLGKTIQKRTKTLVEGEIQYGEWEDDPNPVWDFVDFDYQIKPSDNIWEGYEPFTTREELLNKLKEKGNFVQDLNTRIYQQIIALLPDDDLPIVLTNKRTSFKGLFDSFVFIDNTVIGKLIIEGEGLF